MKVLKNPASPKTTTFNISSIFKKIANSHPTVQIRRSVISQKHTNKHFYAYMKVRVIRQTNVAVFTTFICPKS